MHAGIQQHALLYPSSGFHDELAWAAVWLYRATGQSSFLSAASNLFSASQADGNSGCCGYGVFSWDAKSPGDSAHTYLHSTVRVDDTDGLQLGSALPAGVAVLLAVLQPNNSQYVAAVEEFFDWYLPGPGRTVPHTTGGLAYPYQVQHAPSCRSLFG